MEFKLLFVSGDEQKRWMYLYCLFHLVRLHTIGVCGNKSCIGDVTNVTVYLCERRKYFLI